MKKDIISTAIKLCITILIPIVFFVGFIVVDTLKYGHISDTGIIQNYLDNKDLFTELATYAQEENLMNFQVSKDKEKGFEIIPKIDQGVEVNIDNEDVKNGIIHLFNKLKFKHFIKDKNEIYFVRQTDLRFDQGIILFIDGKIPDKGFSTLEPIEGNWYYYESKD